MARSRRLDALRADAYKRADVAAGTDRHPSADVTRYVNQGIAELYDLLVESRGRSYYRMSPPESITTVANATRYELPEDFYRLISVRVGGDDGDVLEPFRAEDEPLLRQSSSGSDWPTHYELQNGYIELLPLHRAGRTVVLEYVPTVTDLVSDADEFDGINGWEEYAVCFAARCMAFKDEEYELARALEGEMGRLRERIQKLAPTRDTFRAERVKDVRGGFLSSRRWF